MSERRPDLVCVTGDLLSRRSGIPELERLLAELRPASSSSGTTTSRTAATRSRSASIRRCSARSRTWRSSATSRSSSSCAGSASRSSASTRGRTRRGGGAARARRPERGSPHPPLPLPGHRRGGSRRRSTSSSPGTTTQGRSSCRTRAEGSDFAHPRIRDVEGVFRVRRDELHVSPGLGTTFVPFRFFAARGHRAGCVAQSAPRVDPCRRPRSRPRAHRTFHGLRSTDGGSGHLERGARSLRGRRRARGRRSLGARDAMRPRSPARDEDTLAIDVHLELEWGAGAEVVARRCSGASRSTSSAWRT